MSDQLKMPAEILVSVHSNDALFFREAVAEADMDDGREFSIDIIVGGGMLFSIRDEGSTTLQMSLSLIDIADMMIRVEDEARKLRDEHEQSVAEEAASEDEAIQEEEISGVE